MIEEKTKLAFKALGKYGPGVWVEFVKVVGQLHGPRRKLAFVLLFLEVYNFLEV